jgi:hypothetical protein
VKPGALELVQIKECINDDDRRTDDNKSTPDDT